MKPISYEQIENALNRCQNYLKNAKKYILISSDKKIYIQDIYYLEVLHNTTTLYTCHQDYKVNYPLNKILDDIHDSHFTRIHKSFAVHLKYVKYIKDNQVILMNGICLNIGRKYIRILKENYWTYLTSREG